MTRFGLRIAPFILLASVTLFLLGCNAIAAFTTFTRCPVSPRQPNHPVSKQMLAPVGWYPVWFVTIDSTSMTQLSQSVAPYNGGTMRKSLLVVATDIEGDVVLTGHQLDGDGVVQFVLRIDDTIRNADGSDTIIYSPDDLTESYTIPNAQITAFGTDAPGYATHPWAVYYPNPGCYQLTATYANLTSSAIVQIRE